MDEQIVINSYSKILVSKYNEILIYTIQIHNELWMYTVEMDASGNSMPFAGSQTKKKRFNLHKIIENVK